MVKLNAVFKTVTGSPIFWGVLGSAGFYSLVHWGPLGTPFINRYFTHHPVEYAETVLFAIGLAALLIRLIEVVGQYPNLRQSPLGKPMRPALVADEQCQFLLGRLGQLPAWRHNEYYVRRLRAALDYVHRLGSAEALEDQLKYLADLDRSRQHNRYGLFRVIIWAIPILGFLGTVVGITMALNGLRPEALDESMLQVTTGLGVKFDTTALALAMSMLLMFIHFFVDRLENSLLEEVDCRVETDLSGRFRRIPAGSDGQVAVIRQMAEELKNGLSAALGENLQAHARHVAAAQLAVAQEHHRHWDKVEQTQLQNAAALAALQAELSRHADVLRRTLEAAGEVTRLQDVLNRNLAALGGAKHIEQTVSGLAAAIHLLDSRLAESPAVPASIQLQSPRPNAHAA